MKAGEPVGKVPHGGVEAEWGQKTDAGRKHLHRARSRRIGAMSRTVSVERHEAPVGATG